MDLWIRRKIIGDPKPGSKPSPTTFGLERRVAALFLEGLGLDPGSSLDMRAYKFSPTNRWALSQGNPYSLGH